MENNKTVGETLKSYSITVNPYLYFYGNLIYIFAHQETVEKLMNFNNPNTRYPLIHYFFLLETIAFYQKRRASTYITPILDRINNIMKEHNFPDWYVDVHLNAIGFFNFSQEIQPMVDTILSEFHDWKKLYNQIYYDKEKLNFLECFFDGLNIFNAGRKKNIISISSHISLLFISLQYSLISYGTPYAGFYGFYGFFNNKVSYKKENYPFTQLYGHTLSFGVQNETEFIEFYSELNYEKYVLLKFNGLSINNEKPKKHELFIPLDKTIQHIPDFEKIYIYLKNKAFLTFLIDSMNTKEKYILFEENQESQKVKDIYLEYFEDKEIVRY